MVKNGWGLLHKGTVKSDVSHKWFDELGRLTELFLLTFTDRIIFGLTANLLYIFDI